MADLQSVTYGETTYTIPVGGSSDWDDITNKPENLVQDASYVHTDNNYTTAEKEKLAGAPTGYVTAEEAETWYSRMTTMQIRFADGQQANFGIFDTLARTRSYGYTQVVLIGDDGSDIAVADLSDMEHHIRTDSSGGQHNSSTLTFHGKKGEKWTPSYDKLAFIKGNGDRRQPASSGNFFVALDPYSFTAMSSPPRPTLTQPLQFGKDGVEDDVTINDNGTDYYICIVFVRSGQFDI